MVAGRSRRRKKPAPAGENELWMVIGTNRSENGRAGHSFPSLGLFNQRGMQHDLATTVRLESVSANALGCDNAAGNVAAGRAISILDCLRLRRIFACQFCLEQPRHFEMRQNDRQYVGSKALQFGILTLVDFPGEKLGSLLVIDDLPG